MAAGASAIFLSGSTGPAVSPREHDPVKIMRAWPVMGTLLTITVWGTDATVMLESAYAARDSIRLVDSLMSTYRPESEISGINAAAGNSAVAVSPQTIHVLLHARRLWRLSSGRFDPTVAPLVGAWGFHDDTSRVPSRSTLDSLAQLVGYSRVEIDTARRTVRLPIRGMALDLGGIAKGFALDLARAALADPSITGGMIDLGGNVLVFGRPPEGSKWVIGIRDPRRNEGIIGTVSIDSGAVATSGDYEHYFIIHGVRYSHIIDPRTGMPSRGVIAATAVGPRGELSDGVSATLLLSGNDAVPIADSLGVAGILVLDRGRSRVEGSDVVVSPAARPIFELEDHTRR
jgi:thiamine biosynthesis lipoprotein